MVALLKYLLSLRRFRIVEPKTQEIMKKSFFAIALFAFVATGVSSFAYSGGGDDKKEKKECSTAEKKACCSKAKAKSCDSKTESSASAEKETKATTTEAKAEAKK